MCADRKTKPTRADLVTHAHNPSGFGPRTYAPTRWKGAWDYSAVYSGHLLRAGRPSRTCRIRNHAKWTRRAKDKTTFGHVRTCVCSRWHVYEYAGDNINYMHSMLPLCGIHSPVFGLLSTATTGAGTWNGTGCTTHCVFVVAVVDVVAQSHILTLC